MGLLKKLKSFFGSGSDDRSGPSGDADVTVEYEPDAESEHAVKGTDEADVSVGAEAGETTGTAAETEETAETAGPDTETEEPAETAQPDTGTEEPAETAQEAEPDDPGGAESPAVDEVKGIGPTYSGRLDGAGIGTVADLAAADPETVAEAAEVSTSRAEDWIERARSRT